MKWAVLLLIIAAAGYYYYATLTPTPPPPEPVAVARAAPPPPKTTVAPSAFDVPSMEDKDSDPRKHVSMDDLNQSASDLSTNGYDANHPSK
jgi:hypothetical protein